MPLDPQARAFLDEIPSGGGARFDDVPLAAIRAGLDALFGSAPREPVAEVKDTSVPGPAGEIPLRIYRPDAGGAPLPLLVYLHGGGFVTGTLDSHDALCRGLANRVGCVVASVGYRLAPENPFPAPLEDCYAAVAGLAQRAAALGVDARRLAVAGDSAGGNLAAATALLCRERGGPALCHQALLYPVVAPDFDTASYRRNAEGYLLALDAMQSFWRHYLGESGDPGDPHANPLRADVSGVAPATVVTAEFDPLLDEGEAYAAHLEAAGVPTRLRCYDGQIHGFLSFAHRMDAGRAALDDVAARLRDAFAG